MLGHSDIFGVYLEARCCLGHPVKHYPPAGVLASLISEVCPGYASFTRTGERATGMQ